MEVTYDALKKRVAKLEAENAGLSANQCLHNIHGDEAGNPYCPRIAELEKMQGTLLTMFRINMIRMNPNLSHEHIDDVLFRIIDQTIDCEFTERNTGDYHEGLEEGIKIGMEEAAKIAHEIAERGHITFNIAAAIRAKIVESPIMSSMSTKPMENMK